MYVNFSDLAKLYFAIAPESRRQTLEPVYTNQVCALESLRGFGIRCKLLNGPGRCSMGVRRKIAALIPTPHACREHIQAVWGQINYGRKLCEAARDLRQYSAELREISFETRLNTRSARERRREARLDAVG
jgi:hypothetical protein